MMCFIVVCLFVFSIGSLQPLGVDAATEQKPSIPISSPSSPKSQTLGNSPSPVPNRENDVISTPKPSLPYWKPVSTGSPPRKPTNLLQPTPSSPSDPQKPAPVPQSPEHPTPKPSDPGSTSTGRKPKGPLPPPPPPPPQDPSSVQQTPKPSDSKPSVSKENEVSGTNKPSSFWGPLNKLFPPWKPKDPSPPTPPSIPQTPKLPTPKPAGPKAPLSAENEVGGKNKLFWKPWSKLFTTPKPECPTPPLSEENEAVKPHKPSPPFWDPFIKLFPTRKPKDPLPPTSLPVPQNPVLPTPKPPVPTLPPSKSKDLVFPTPKPLIPSNDPKPTVQKDTDKKPTDHPNDMNQRRDTGYGFESEERTTKKSYLKEICPCCF